MLAQIEAGAAAYEIPLRLRLEGPLDRAALAAALTSVAARHEALRTTFGAPGGELQQSSIRPAPVLLQEVDPALAETARAEPFDLATGPLFRAAVAQLGPHEHILELNIHHIVCDGWSLREVMKSLRAAYASALAGRAPGWPPLARQYRHYAAEQHEALASGAWQADRAYWLAKLGGELPVLELPLDRPRPALQTFAGDAVSVRFEPAVAEALRAFAEARRMSVFSVLTAVIKVLLHRYTAQRDLIVGTADAGRHSPELEEQVGCYLNMLALRDVLDPEESFETFALQVRQTVLEALDHHRYPFDHLVESLALRRDLSRAPLCDVTIVSQTAAELAEPMGELHVTALPQPSRTSKFDLTFDCELGADYLQIGIEYNSDLFLQERIARMAGHLQTLLPAALRTPELPVRELPLLSPEERAMLLSEAPRDLFSGPPPSVTTRLAQAMRTWPDDVAVAQDGQHVTYAQFGARAHAIASRLRQAGIGPGDVVGVLGTRSPDLVAALVGVLFAGAAYLPLDALYPAERLRYMLQNSGARIVITDAASRPGLPDGGVTVLELERDFPTAPGEAVPIEPAPAELAYVIYTSGSTGQPKGVEVPRGALANFLASMEQEPGLRRGDVLVAVTTICFDIAALELLLPLCVGARIVLASAETAASSSRLAALLSSSAATVLQATPATWRMLLADGWPGAPQLRALCGGEALPVDLAGELLPRVAELWNLYGPTETTVWSAARRVERVQEGRAAELIGPVIAQTRLCALDPWLAPVPTGVTGELYIGGEGVARGYRGRPELTAEKFIPDPFSSVPGARLYRTGDLVRPMGDGLFEFLGRGDGQVKLRGFRVELGEIEAVLRSHPDIVEAAVAARTDAQGETVLAGYIVSRTGTAPEGWRELLHERLPAYMAPAILLCLPQLPLTQNGKIDRRALPAWDAASQPRAARVLPRTELERLLARCWKETLALDEVGVDENFFELGGHSLRAMRIIAALQEAHGVTVSLRDFFLQPTIAGLAAVVQQSDRPAPEVAPTARLKRARPLAAPLA